MSFLGFLSDSLVTLICIFAFSIFSFQRQSVYKFYFGGYTHFGPAETFCGVAQNGSMIVCSICSNSNWCGDDCDCACHDEDFEDDEDEFDDDDLDDDDDIEPEED